MRVKLEAVALMFAAILTGCGGGGGGGPEAPATAPAPAPQPLLGMAGVYENVSTSGQGLATAIIDEQGRMLVSTYHPVYHPELTMLRYVDFSGQAVLTGSGGWTIPDALVYSREAIGPPLVETSRTLSGTVTGTYTSDQGLTTTVGIPPAPQFYQGTFNYQRKLRISDGPITMAAVTGRYSGFECTGSPRNPVCVVVNEYTIDASGRIGGRLTRECEFDGSIVVAQADARVLRATGTFNSAVAGVACPASGSAVLLGAFDGAAPNHQLTWYFTQPDGKVNSTFAYK